VTGTITPDQVLAQTAQGFAAGDFDELVRAIHNGAAYANVHSTMFTPGEIRGHIRVRRDK
jgi:CHRD domain